MRKKIVEVTNDQLGRLDGGTGESGPLHPSTIGCVTSVCMLNRNLRAVRTAWPASAGRQWATFEEQVYPAPSFGGRQATATSRRPEAPITLQSFDLTLKRIANAPQNKRPRSQHATSQPPSPGGSLATPTGTLSIGPTCPRPTLRAVEAPRFATGWRQEKPFTMSTKQAALLVFPRSIERDLWDGGKANRPPHRSLYRRSLKLALDWTVHRSLWRGQALYIRSLFEKNRNVTNPRQQRVRHIQHPPAAWSD